MGSKTDYLEDAINDHVLRNVAYTSPTTVYLALYDADPGEAGTAGTEVSTGGYARQSITMGASAGGVTTNSAKVSYAKATAAYLAGANVVGWGIMDAVTFGNMLYHGALTVAKAVALDDTPEFAIGDISVTED